MKHLYGFILLLLIQGCGKPTYPKEKIEEDLKKVVHKEYGISDLKVKRDDNTLWVYLPVNKLMDEKYKLSESSLEKIRKVSAVIYRILVSSDAEIKFVAFMAYDLNGVELRMIRHIEDIKKVRYWYISLKDYYTRSDISIDFNPEILGKKIIKNLYLNDDINEVRDYISLKKKEEVSDKLLTKFGDIQKCVSLRISKNKALIYVETRPPNLKKALFLIDVEFSDILKNLLVLYSGIKEKNNKKKDGYKKEKGLSYPIIADYWDLDILGWPEEYRKYRKIKNWDNQLYTKKIDFEEFISQQIKRKIESKFKTNYDKWKIKFKEIEVYYIENLIQVTSDINKIVNPVYEVDPDYEIGITVAKTIKAYELNKVDNLIIHSPLWEIKRDIKREELIKMKPKKWKRIRKEAGLSLKNILLMMFVPNYGNYNVQKK